MLHKSTHEHLHCSFSRLMTLTVSHCPPQLVLVLVGSVSKVMSFTMFFNTVCANDSRRSDHAVKRYYPLHGNIGYRDSCGSIPPPPQVPVGVSCFYHESKAPSIPTLAVAAGHQIFVYRYLRPHLKYSLPKFTVDPREIEIWNDLKIEKVSEAVDKLNSMRNDGVRRYWISWGHVQHCTGLHESVQEHLHTRWWCCSQLSCAADHHAKIEKCTTSQRRVPRAPTVLLHRLHLVNNIMST